MSLEALWITIVVIAVIVWACMAVYEAKDFVNKMRDYLAKGYDEHQKTKDNKIFYAVEEAQHDFENRPRNG